MSHVTSFPLVVCYHVDSVKCVLYTGAYFQSDALVLNKPSIC